MKVLVLGGHGFIGSHVVEALSGDGHFVRAYARHGSETQLNAEWFPGDFLDKGKLSEALLGMDAVVHCISTTVPVTSASNYRYDIESNLIGTVELLQLMEAQGIERLIHFSSGGTVYGNPEHNPVNEAAPLNPISSYGAVKVAIEKYIEIFRLSGKIKPVVLRPSNPYGERQAHTGVQGLISTLLNNAIDERETEIYGDGSSVRDYIHVKDLANLVSEILKTDQCGIYNAGSGEGLSINQVISVIESTTGLSVPRKYLDARDFDVNEIVLDNSLAFEHFGWKATTSLVDGISKQYQWLKSIDASPDR